MPEPVEIYLGRRLSSCAPDILPVRGSYEISRRSFLYQDRRWRSPRSRLLPARRRTGLKIGVTDWNLQLAGKVEAVALAHRIGFDGVEVSLGRKPVDNKLPWTTRNCRNNIWPRRKSKESRWPEPAWISSTSTISRTTNLGQKWLADAIPITKKLNATVMLMPFFGKGAMTTPEEMDYVGDVLKEIAPEAEKAGILLGLEDTISAENNVRIMDRVPLEGRARLLRRRQLDQRTVSRW